MLKTLFQFFGKPDLHVKHVVQIIEIFNTKITGILQVEFLYFRCDKFS